MCGGTAWSYDGLLSTGELRPQAQLNWRGSPLARIASCRRRIDPSFVTVCPTDAAVSLTMAYRSDELNHAATDASICLTSIEPALMLVLGLLRKRVYSYHRDHQFFFDNSHDIPMVTVSEVPTRYLIGRCVCHSGWTGP